MAEIIPFRSKEKREQDKRAAEYEFFSEQKKYLNEAIQDHDSQTNTQFEYFDPVNQTGYEITPDVLESLDEEIKIAQKTSMSDTNNKFINSDITSDEWDWLKSWLEEERKKNNC